MELKKMPNSHCRNLNPKGFTLLELLISITILVMVITTVYAAFSTGLKAQKKQEEANYRNQSLRQAWRMMARDLRCAYVSDTNKNAIFIGEHNTGAGNSDKITFVTALPGTGSKYGGLAVVSYYVSPGKGLIKENKGFPSYAPEETEGRLFEAAPLVKSLDITYFDGKNWSEEWGTENSKISSFSLPLQVQIKFVFENDKKPVTELIPVYVKK
ncbi:MAG: prepilin-type N-terminal cleavage/methylation domain-containing protein [Elusimicrobia bacterium]|nr:prepilin-type N-terminal cleavage/methylation domain-containing protein [Candidatus Liberimonas magnetica]